jgi:hypothetical protein
MMIVNVQIAATFRFEVKESVPREQFQHVIEEGDAGVDARVPASVERERDARLRLLRPPVNFRFAYLYFRAYV